MNGACTHDKQTITELRAQADDMVEEVHLLSASKSLFVEMSGIFLYFFLNLQSWSFLLFFDFHQDILKQDVEAFTQEKDTWKMEKEKLQAYFDDVIVDLEARLAQVRTPPFEPTFLVFSFVLFLYLFCC